MSLKVGHFLDGCIMPQDVDSGGIGCGRDGSDMGTLCFPLSSAMDLKLL